MKAIDQKSADLKLFHHKKVMHNKAGQEASGLKKGKTTTFKTIEANNHISKTIHKLTLEYRFEAEELKEILSKTNVFLLETL